MAVDVREKLAELLKEISYDQKLGWYDLWDMRDGAEDIADSLIAHGVTVQEGKPLEVFLRPIDTYKGLKAKYLVFKADTGEKVENCFILRPAKDSAAVKALRAYASATDNETLAEDIYNWVGKGEPVQEWISVKDRLPEEPLQTVIVTNGKETCVAVYSVVYDEFGVMCGKGKAFGVTHWMPLPDAPKGE